MNMGELVEGYAEINSTSHFCKRALERHGLMLGKHEIADIKKQIFEQKADFLCWSQGDDFRSFYRVRIYDQPYIVLFDLSISALVTIYHNSWLKLVNGVWVKKRKYRKGGRYDYQM